MNKNNISGHLLILLLSLSLAWSALAEAEAQTASDAVPENSRSRPLIIAQDSAWHPFAYLDEQQQPQGLLIDYWRRVGEKIGRDVQFKLVDWQASLDLVRNGEADLHGGLFESEQRRTFFRFSESLIPLSTRLFVSSSLNAKGFDDLEPVQVGITRGGYEGEFVSQEFPALHLKYYDNNQQLVQAALKGEVLAFVADYPVGMYYLHKHGSPEQFRVVSTLYTKYLKSAVALNNVGLLDSLNAGLQAMGRDEKDAIIQKWIRTETVTPPWLLTVMLAVASLLLLIGGFAYTILLRSQVRRQTSELRAEVEESLRLRSENTELVKELRRQKDDAEQANRAKSRFLAAASHDLRQPLHALSLFTSVLGDTIKYPEVRRVVDQIQSSVFSLQNLFDALLDISKLDAGEQVVEKIALPLSPLFAKLANDYSPQAYDKGLNIHWPVCEEAVESDPYLLEQILRNLVSNAIRYTHAGDIHLECECHGDEVCITVSDSGIGIPQDDLELIFEEFQQLNNPERDRSKGLGLGLAIVRRAARLLGHRIEVSSRVGEGSRFLLYLAHAGTDACSEQNASPAAQITTNCYGLTFLVIDDEASLREGMQARLKLWGCEALLAENEEEALTLLRQHPGDVHGLIVDYRLRGHRTGIEAVQALQAAMAQRVPVLIVTGDVAAQSQGEIKAQGLQCLHKPVAPAKLHAFVRSVFKQHEPPKS